MLRCKMFLFRDEDGSGRVTPDNIVEEIEWNREELRIIRDAVAAAGDAELRKTEIPISDCFDDYDDSDFEPLQEADGNLQEIEEEGVYVLDFGNQSAVFL